MNTITIIGYILTFSSFIWMILYMIRSRSREYISYEIKNGAVCYRCKSDIRNKYDVNFFGVKEKKELCASCKRDDALSEVIDKYSWYRKIDFGEEKWNKAFIWLSVIAVFFNCVNMFVNGLNIIGGFSLFTAQSIFYFRYLAISRKKEKTQSN